MQVQRLKGKVAQRSNSNGEVEFQDAYGILMGEEGRGYPPSSKWQLYTRLNCVVGSAGMVRQAWCRGWPTRQRKTFGRHLVDQPLMRAVLTDLALEKPMV